MVRAELLNVFATGPRLACLYKISGNMFRVPDYYRNVSRVLSQVMDDIGVNPRIVNVRRRTYMLIETMFNLTHIVLGVNATCYHLGSQSEGTTTEGLQSDTDGLLCSNDINIITDWGDWVQGKSIFLMIQDATTPPGYCRLQVLRSDFPVALDGIPIGMEYSNRQYLEYDGQGRVFLKNTFSELLLKDTNLSNGPAVTYKSTNSDHVIAFLIHTKRAVSLVERLERYSTMIRTALEEQCIVVPTGHPNSTTELVEWRISTCMAERLMMHSMNITQLRCYVLLKIIVKSFITKDFPDTISSYHCKTVVMHCIENVHNDVWCEENLLTCVTICLQFLYNCVITNTCSHYFIPRNNLFEGRIDYRTRKKLALILKQILCSNGDFLLELRIDNIGQRLLQKLSPLVSNGISNQLNDLPHHRLILELNWYVFMKVMHSLKQIGALFSTDIHALNEALNTLTLYSDGDSVQRQAVELMMPSLCTTMATCIASNCVTDGHQLSTQALSFFAMGIDSDVSSGRLKLASALFCSGDIERTELVLRDVETRYNPGIVEAICSCFSTRLELNPWRIPFDILQDENLNLMRSYLASGIVFTRGEKNCVPPGLQYEMFRCTEEELATRREVDDDWMDNAVVDSLPYLYYLQYLTYGQLGGQPEQQRALNNLIKIIREEPCLFHRETALNLLGQCMEHESRLQDALLCYRLSLNERPTHNVARWHIINALSILVNNT